MKNIVEQILSSYNFGNFIQVTNRASISDFFKKADPVPGLYVLSFMDGAYYAGKTKNIRQRFRTHYKNHGDIEYLSFKELEPELQDLEEGPLIQKLKSSGIRLRNIQFISDPDLHREIDDMIPLSAQEHWIETGICQDQELRQVNEEQRYRYARKFHTLSKEELFNPLMAFARTYSQIGIIAPQMTEMSYWCSSVWPTPSSYVRKKSGREYIRINIANCEVLTIGRDWEYDDYKPGTFFAFHTAYPVGVSNLEEYLKNNHKGVEPIGHRYITMGENQVSFVAFGFENAINLLQDVVIQKAIRQGNMALMRKRACLYSKNHCYDLADHLISNKPIDIIDCNKSMGS